MQLRFLKAIFNTPKKFWDSCWEWPFARVLTVPKSFSKFARLHLWLSPFYISCCSVTLLIKAFHCKCFFMDLEKIFGMIFLESTAQKMKFSIKNFFSKCDQFRRKLWIWSHLLRKSIMENFIFCVVEHLWAFASERHWLTNFGQYSYFVALKSIKTPSGFLKVSEGIERSQWHGMGWEKNTLPANLSEEIPVQNINCMLKLFHPLVFVLFKFFLTLSFPSFLSWQSISSYIKMYLNRFQNPKWHIH